ncbi:MAG: hypothetical protein Q7S50_01020 [bacterium]|nr:hypothetical protein [bacterium]
MVIVELGIIAASLQAAGYFFYGARMLRRDILPNPTSWLMFAYGTTLILILEWDRDASLALLILPATCAISSIVVALYALRGARSWLPEHPFDRFSFAFDILLTLVYLFTWFLLVNGFIVETQKNLADIIILVSWNIDISAFFPLLRQVYRHPHTEHAMPWIVWTGAYSVLVLATVIETGIFNELILYPFINMIIHGSIAIRVGLWHWMRSQPII